MCKIDEKWLRANNWTCVDWSDDERSYWDNYYHKYMKCKHHDRTYKIESDNYAKRDYIRISHQYTRYYDENDKLVKVINYYTLEAEGNKYEIKNTESKTKFDSETIDFIKNLIGLK